MIEKLCKLDLPHSVINWVIDFLTDRHQQVKLADGCFSEWGTVPSGVPQGTKLGPWLFIMIINDLIIDEPHFWKFVDDTTASELIPKGNVSNAQHIIDQVSDWSHTNRVQLNSDKCKEMGMTFAKRFQEFEPLHVDGKDLEVVETVKLLGLTIGNNLTWNVHIREVVKKAAKRLNFLVHLKRSKVLTNDLVLFYTACIRSI